MSIGERIVYSGNELIQTLEEFLDRMKVFTYDSRYSMLLGNSIIDKIREWDKAIRKQKDLPLTLTVCGEFKRGKSSLINALLGEDVVTTNITTETITTNRISYGVHKNELIVSGGGRITLSDEELKSENLKNILKDLPEGTKEIELHRPIEILKEMTIVDTPGLGDSVADYFSDVQNALMQSDAVIYVFSALYPLSIQEQLFIKNAIKPQKYTELILVSNFSDSFDDEEACARVSDVINERISAVLPGEKHIMVSALDERCRQLGAERPNGSLSPFLEKNFSSLRTRLAELLDEKREYVIPNRVHRLITGMTEELNMLLDALMQGVTLSYEEIVKKSEELSSYMDEQGELRSRETERIGLAADKSEQDTIRLIDALLSAMESETGGLSRYSVEDVKSNYSLYCTETIQGALDRCIDKFTGELYGLLDETSADISRSFSAAGISATPSFRFAIQNKSWTAGDNVAMAGRVVTTYVFASSLLGTVMDYVAGSMRQKAIKQSMPDVISEIRKQFPGLRAATLEAIKDAYASIRENVKKLISDYYTDQVNSIGEQLSQAAEVAKQSDAKKEEIRSAVLDVRNALDEIARSVSLVRDDIGE